MDSFKRRLLITVSLAGSFFAGIQFKSCSAPDHGSASAVPMAGSSPTEDSRPESTPPASAAGASSATDTDSGVMAVMNIKEPLARLAAWTALLQRADKAALMRISAEMNSWYESGGASPNDEVGLLQFREGQLLGLETILDGFPSDPNGFLVENPLRKMRGWASVESGVAKQWLDSLDDGNVKSAMFAAWFEGSISSGDAGKARALFDSLPEGVKSGAMGTLMEAIHRTEGMDGVYRWFADCSGREDSGVPLQSAFEKLAWRAGQMDAAGSEGLLKRPEFARFITDGNFAGLTRNIAIRNPGRVLELAAEWKGPDGPFTPQQLGNIAARAVRYSGRYTIDNLGNWLNSNPDHPLYNLGARYLVENAVSLNREAASAWAAKITDPALKAEAEAVLSK